MSSKKRKKRHHGAQAASGANAQGQQGRRKQPKISLAKVAGDHGALPGDPAPVGRRFLAYLIDWYLGGLCIALPISFVANLLTGDITNQRLVDFPAPYGMVTGGFALLFACLYYVLIPLVLWRGQTPGKRICRLRIEMRDGAPVDAVHLVLRQVVGVFLLSGVITNASGIIQQMLTIMAQANLVHPLMYFGFAVTAVSCGLILFRHDHRCIHDFIGGTEVRLVEKEEPEEEQAAEGEDGSGPDAPTRDAERDGKAAVSA